MGFKRLKRIFGRGRFSKSKEIDPDQIFLDSSNLPKFDLDQFEGRLERPISSVTMYSFLIVVLTLVLFLSIRTWNLEVSHGNDFAKKSEANRLDRISIFASRGSILDKNGVKLAWNTVTATTTTATTTYDLNERRAYTVTPGFSHILGYVTYPARDKNGFYFRTDYEGVNGIEGIYNSVLAGEHGTKITETNALGSVTSELVEQSPNNGENLELSIDYNVQAKLYEAISALAKKVGFSGGAGGIMNVNTGEIIALTSYPEFKSSAMSDGNTKLVSQYVKDTAGKPFLNRFTDGLYTPGSIVKPFVALGALSEKVIDPNTQILSTGSISVPNPYDPTRKTTFSDWKAHGLVDMRKAIAVSSNVYFYEIGGGFENQKGLGIVNLNKYFSLFGFGKGNSDPSLKGPAGVIPSPEWKDKTFPGDQWRIGDTYFTSIGQYGFQVTPLQMLRAYSSIANGGTLIDPTIISRASSTESVSGTALPFTKEQFKVIHEGMRQGAVIGTAAGLNVPYVEIAAKTGTAELGSLKQFVNSWAVGFWPFKNPKYAFTVIMEHGPRGNIYGGVYVAREMFDWFEVYAPEYLK